MVLTFLMGLAFLLTQVVEYLNVGFNTGDGAFASVFFGLTGLHGAHVAIGLSLLLMVIIRGFRGPLLAGAPPRRRASRDLLALRGRHVDRGLRDRLPHLRLRDDVESPFRSEAAAFQFLLITIGAFALIVVASVDHVRARVPRLPGALGRGGLGLPSAARAGSRRASSVEHVGGPDERRVLVVANETVAGEELMSAISTLALTQTTSFLVVCPALNSRLKTWTSDEDPARAAAQKRLDATLARLAVGRNRRARRGRRRRPARRRRGRGADVPPGRDRRSRRIPAGRSNWLERGVVDSVRARFDVPVTHVVVDLEAQP